MIPPPPGSLAARLVGEGYAFDFFQAVRLLEKLQPEKKPVGYASPPAEEIVRFRAQMSLAFPASAVDEIALASAETPPDMTVTFFGLFGPSGILPRHYTELLLRLHRELKGPERTALRDWLDLFNHRLLSLFYRAWEKYRFFASYERSAARTSLLDSFQQSLFSLVGLGTPGLQDRLRVGYWDPLTAREQILTRVEDQSLAFFAGLLASRQRNAANLASYLQDYFGLPIAVRQFQGHWLNLDDINQSRLGEGLGNNELGTDAVAGGRIWDIQGKIRLRVGPLKLERFLDFLPDRTPLAQRKAFFLLVHLVRLYVGPELEFDVQLVLDPTQVPECALAEEGDDVGPRLGWNTWLITRESSQPADDALFEGDDVFWVNDEQRLAGIGN